MKKTICLLLTLLLICLPCTLPAAAAGSVAVTADRTTVTIGSNVTVTLKYDGGNAGIGSLDAAFSYNAKTFEYVSCTGATANGAAGVVSISYFATDAVSPKALTVTLTFKAIAAGDGSFSLKTEGMWDDSDALLGTPSKTLSVTATNPTKSGNADLASLKPSKGTLTPKFSANTTSYTITVPYTVTSLTLSATTSHAEAKTAVSGKNALEVGKNTRVITVTAPNGTTKKYTVVITRSPNENTTTGTKPDGGTTTTVPQPAEDALEVEVNGQLMVVPEVQPTVDLPGGYRWDTVPINGIDVPAAKNEQSGIVLLHLTHKEDKTAAFYIYDATAGAFSAFRPFAVPGGTFVLHDLPDSETGPAGTVPGTLTYEGGSVSAYVYEDAAQADFSIVYATSPAGVTGLYVYDRTDGSLQRYREIRQPVEDIPPTDDTPGQPTGGFVTFLTTHKTVILLIAAVCGGLALLIGAVILLIRFLHRPRSFKH